MMKLKVQMNAKCQMTDRELLAGSVIDRFNYLTI